MNNLPFDFNVDKANRTVYINKQFAASQSLVWDAFTTPEILDQWWAPKPWMSKTKEMQFAPGGRRLYAMVGPAGEEHWSVQQYTSINPKTNYSMLNAFSDAQGNPALPGSNWDHHFSETGGITTVSITITNESQERFDMMLEMGFQGGFTMTLNYLETLLPGLAVAAS